MFQDTDRSCCKVGTNSCGKSVRSSTTVRLRATRVLVQRLVRASRTLNPEPCTLRPEPQTPNPEPSGRGIERVVPRTPSRRLSLSLSLRLSLSLPLSLSLSLSLPLSPSLSFSLSLSLSLTHTQTYEEQGLNNGGSWQGGASNEWFSHHTSPWPAT